jgi:hypothetical protein
MVEESHHTPKISNPAATEESQHLIALKLTEEEKVLNAAHTKGAALQYPNKLTPRKDLNPNPQKTLLFLLAINSLFAIIYIYNA